jgi:hypothetical protein
MRDPANLPTLLQSFFTIRLMTQRKVSAHTIASYRDTFRLLLQFAQKGLRKAPSQLELGDLNASFGQRVPGRSGKASAQWLQEPKSALDGHSVILPLRRPGSAGAERNHPTGASPSKPTTATCTGGFSHATGDRSVVGGTGSNAVAGTP